MKLSERLTEQRNVLLAELDRHREDIVIVEGKRDAEALHDMGFTRVMVVNRGRGLYDFSVDVKAINGDRVVLVLTDFDPEGDEIAKKLETYLRSIGCRTDRASRESLRRLFCLNKLTTVQGLRNLKEFV